MKLLLVSSWRETRRNLRRSWAVALLLATSLTAATGLLSAEVMVDRELARSFVDTRPAAVVVHTTDIDIALLETVAAVEGVTGVDARTTNRARIETDDGSLVPFVLTTTLDPLAPTVNVFSVESSFTAPDATSIWIESRSFPVLGLDPGGTASIDVGGRRTPAILGEAIDEGGTPGDVELRVFAYATPEATGQLGFDPTMTELRIATEPGSDSAAILKAVDDVITASGRTIEFSSATNIPEHPHAAQMRSITAVTRTFALLTVVASLALVAQIAASVALSARRQLAMLALIGASTRQLVTRQLALFAVPALVGTALGLPGGLWLGAQVADLALSQLSIRAASLLPPWTTTVLATGAILGVLTVIVICTSWIVGCTSVASSLSLAPATNSPASRIGTGLWAYPARSALRRPVRTLTMTAVLALAGAMVLSGFSLRAGWEATAESFADRRNFDIAVAVEPADAEAAMTALSDLGFVKSAERWATTPIGSATNPDEPVGNGGGLIALDPTTAVARVTVIEGNWLGQDAERQVVLDESLRDELGATVGELVSLAIYGRTLDFEVVGVTKTDDSATVREAFVDLDQLEARLGLPSLSNTIYVQTEDSNRDRRQRSADQVDLALSSSGVFVNDVQTIDEQRSLIANHILPLVAVLLLLGLMAAAIALIGVAITGEINIQERRREIAVLRLLGASADRLAGLLATEAILIAALAASVAIPLGLVLASAVAAPIGQALLGQPVPVSIGLVASAAWMAISVAIAALAITVGTRALIEKPLTTEITR